MDIEFVNLPVSVPHGDPGEVTIVVRHVVVGAHIDVRLSNPLGVEPPWPAEVQHVVARPVSPRSADGFAIAMFSVTLSGPCVHAHLLAEARDRDNFYYATCAKGLEVT